MNYNYEESGVQYIQLVRNPKSATILSTNRVGNGVMPPFLYLIYINDVCLSLLSVKSIPSMVIQQDGSPLRSVRVDTMQHSSCFVFVVILIPSRRLFISNEPLFGMNTWKMSITVCRRKSDFRIVKNPSTFIMQIA